jgi:4-aminobutyrate aminotransferase-like enzyme
MIGIECARPQSAQQACGRALERGVVLLPSGEGGRVLSITPPLSIERPILSGALDVLVDVLS